MAGAIPVHLVAWSLRRGRPSAWGPPLPAKSSHVLDGRLLVGASLFGVGWGLTGVCPGPAVTNVAAASTFTLVVLASILAGVALSFLVPARARSAMASSPRGRNGSVDRGACGSSRSSERRYATQPSRNSGHAGTAGHGSVFSGKRPQSAG
jgi:hypothetical protein